jgi:hypothetical protein
MFRVTGVQTCALPIFLRHCDIQFLAVVSVSG